MKLFAGLITAIIWLPCWWFLLNCYYGSSSDLYMRVHLVNSSGEQVWATLVGTSRHDGARDQALTLYYSSPVPLEVPWPYELTLGPSKERDVIYDFDLHQFTAVLVRGKEGPTRRLSLPLNDVNEGRYTSQPIIVRVPPLVTLEPLVVAPEVKQPEFFAKVWAIAIVGYLVPVGLVAYISTRLRHRKLSETFICGAMPVVCCVVALSCATQNHDAGTPWPSANNRHCARVTEGRSGPPWRALVIECVRDRKLLYSVPIERKVGVSWSPAGAKCAIVDDFASNESRILVVDGNSGQCILEVNRKNLSDLNPSVPQSRQYSHLVLSGFRWLSASEFVIRVLLYDRLVPSVQDTYSGVCNLKVRNTLSSSE